MLAQPKDSGCVQIFNPTRNLEDPIKITHIIHFVPINDFNPLLSEISPQMSDFFSLYSEKKKLFFKTWLTTYSDADIMLTKIDGLKN